MLKHRIPALEFDRQILVNRTRYDFSDYGFCLDASLAMTFEISIAHANDEEAFLFFYPKEDLEVGAFSLYNLHAFLKRTGSVENFAHSLGESVRSIKLQATEILGIPAKTYSRVIAMRDLFQGAPQVIDFIGGQPSLEVTDSHTYFQHRHNHYYTGMLHEPGNDQKYKDLRNVLFERLHLRY